MRRTAIALAALVLLAACSNASEQPTASSASAVSVLKDGTQVIDLRETDKYRFTPDEPHVRPGTVRIDFSNTSKTVTHSLAFKPGGPTEEIPFINPGDKKSITFDIENPGKYKFFCTFHESLGQRGTLVVDQP